MTTFTSSFVLTYYNNYINGLGLSLGLGPPGLGLGLGPPGLGLGLGTRGLFLGLGPSGLGLGLGLAKKSLLTSLILTVYKFL